MFSIDSYKASIQSNLEKQTGILVQELQKIISYTFDPAVELVDFSTFTDPTRFELTIMMFSMDTNAGEVFGEAITPQNFAGSVEVLSDMIYHYVPDHEAQAFSEFYLQNDEELGMKEQQIFTDWFITCWEKAGGQAFNLPAYFGFHDVTPSYDLQNARIVEDTEKWS